MGIYLVICYLFTRIAAEPKSQLINYSFLTVDNGTREGLDKFLKAASDEPETVLHYEFMQDYKVCAGWSFAQHAHSTSYLYVTPDLYTVIVFISNKKVQA